MSPPITPLTADDRHTFWIFPFHQHMLINLRFKVKSKCSVLLWPDAQPLLSAPEQEKRPSTLNSLPRLHAPSSLAPVLGPRPRLHAMLREVLVLIQPPTPTPMPLSPLAFSPFLLTIISVFNFQKHTGRENMAAMPEQLSLIFQTAYYHQKSWISPLPRNFVFLLQCSSLSPHI